MSTETFFICDVCGDPQLRKERDDLRGWRHVSSEPMVGESGRGLFIPSWINGITDEPEAPTKKEDPMVVWNLCPKCGPLLPIFFTGAMQK